MTRRTFNGKTIVVTGAASGLGRALANRFANSGASIAALDTNGSGLEQLRRELEIDGGACIALPCDVTEAEGCQLAIEATERRFGSIDVLINNAGISHRSGFTETGLDVIRKVMEVNFFGAVNCSKAALPALISSRGMIIAISSVAGFSPLLARSGYAASKHAMHGFFESVRTEVAPRGVDVLMVCPSFVDTDIDRHALAGDGEPVRHEKVVVGRRMTPEYVAARVHDAAAAGRRRLLVGSTARLAWWLNRTLPATFERAMARRMRSELESS